jgi:tRNA(fMet)-specific endonuclease VapC
MKYLLDSNILIALGLDADKAVSARAAECDADDLVTSAIAYAGLEVLIEEVPVVPFDYAAARAYAAIPFKRASYDHLIAAHALALGLTLVTDNEKHFADVPGLKVENWTV